MGEIVPVTNPYGASNWPDRVLLVSGASWSVLGSLQESKSGWILDKILSDLDRSGWILAEILSDFDRSGRDVAIFVEIQPRSLYIDGVLSLGLPVFRRNTRSAIGREKGIGRVGCFGFSDRQTETQTNGIGSLRR